MLLPRLTPLLALTHCPADPNGAWLWQITESALRQVVEWWHGLFKPSQMSESLSRHVLPPSLVSHRAGC